MTTLPAADVDSRYAAVLRQARGTSTCADGNSGRSSGTTAPVKRGYAYVADPPTINVAIATAPTRDRPANSTTAIAASSEKTSTRTSRIFAGSRNSHRPGTWSYSQRLASVNGG